MKKAYVYMRVSGKGQIEGDGFSRQMEATKAYAHQNAITITDIFREEGITGTAKWDDRPAWIEMLDRMAGTGVKTVLIERLDRVARDLMVQEHIMLDLGKRGIELISVYEPDLCSDDPTRVLMRQIMGAIAQYDKAMIVLKLRGARQRAKAANGSCEGAKPFGAWPGEDVTLVEIGRMVSEGFGMHSIALKLNAMGCSTRRGKGWSARVVTDIVNREFPVYGPGQERDK